jgi:hypothetical protein
MAALRRPRRSQVLVWCGWGFLAPAATSSINIVAGEIDVSFLDRKSPGRADGSAAVIAELDPDIALNRTWNVAFAGLAVIGFLNGSAHRVQSAVLDDASGAILGTFGISIIVWAGIACATAFLWAPPGRDLSRRDISVALSVSLLFLIPAAPFSWIGLTILAIHLVASSARGSLHRRGGVILLALTVPMFWSRLAISLFGDVLLRLDAGLVALVTGAPRFGNSIAFADGWGYYWIAPPCSSIANISLAFLTFVLASEIPNRSGKIGLRYCFLAVSAVVAINIARLSITGISRAHYDLIHGPAGSFLAGGLSSAAMVGICWWGTRAARHA